MITQCLTSNLMPDNLTGYRYSCSDSAVYALWEKNGGYLLEKVDVQTGNHNTIIILNGVAPGIIPESSCVNDQGIYAYRGFDSSNSIAVISIDLATGIVNAIAHTNDNAAGFEEGICCYDTTSTSVSLIELPGYNTLEVSPNPVKDKLNINFPGVDSNMLEVYSESGQLVLRKKLLEKPESMVLEVANWRNGIYIIQLLTTEGSKYSARIFKE